MTGVIRGHTTCAVVSPIDRSFIGICDITSTAILLNNIASCSIGNGVIIASLLIAPLF